MVENYQEVFTWLVGYQELFMIRAWNGHIRSGEILK